GVMEQYIVSAYRMLDFNEHVLWAVGRTPVTCSAYCALRALTTKRHFQAPGAGKRCYVTPRPYGISRDSLPGVRHLIGKQNARKRPWQKVLDEVVTLCACI